jgi:hypothetical protein
MWSYLRAENRERDAYKYFVDSMLRSDKIWLVWPAIFSANRRLAAATIDRTSTILPLWLSVGLKIGAINRL